MSKPYTSDAEAEAVIADATALLHRLDTAVPANTIHYAVEDARRALRALIRVTAPNRGAALNGCADCAAGRHAPHLADKPGECPCCHAKVGA